MTANRNWRTKLQVESLEGRAVPAVHAFHAFGPALVSHRAPLDNGTEDLQTGPDPDNVQQGPGAQDQSGGNTQDTTGGADNTPNTVSPVATHSAHHVVHHVTHGHHGGTPHEKEDRGADKRGDK